MTLSFADNPENSNAIIAEAKSLLDTLKNGLGSWEGWLGRGFSKDEKDPKNFERVVLFLTIKNLLEKSEVNQLILPDGSDPPDLPTLIGALAGDVESQWATLSEEIKMFLEGIESSAIKLIDFIDDEIFLIALDSLEEEEQLKVMADILPWLNSTEAGLIYLKENCWAETEDEGGKVLKNSPARVKLPHVNRLTSLSADTLAKFVDKGHKFTDLIGEISETLIPALNDNFYFAQNPVSELQITASISKIVKYYFIASPGDAPKLTLLSSSETFVKLNASLISIEQEALNTGYWSKVPKIAESFGLVLGVVKLGFAINKAANDLNFRTSVEFIGNVVEVGNNVAVSATNLGQYGRKLIKNTLPLKSIQRKMIGKAFRRLNPYANAVGAVFSAKDAFSAYNNHNYTAAGGHALSATAGVALIAFTFFPVGALAYGLTLGVWFAAEYVAETTQDAPLEAWMKKCYFGKFWVKPGQISPTTWESGDIGGFDTIFWNWDEKWDPGDQEWKPATNIPRQLVSLWSMFFPFDVSKAEIDSLSSTATIAIKPSWGFVGDYLVLKFFKDKNKGVPFVSHDLVPVSTLFVQLRPPEYYKPLDLPQWIKGYPEAFFDHTVTPKRFVEWEVKFNSNVLSLSTPDAEFVEVDIIQTTTMDTNPMGATNLHIIEMLEKTPVAMRARKRF